MISDNSQSEKKMKSLEQFSQKLFNHLNTNDNVFISPFCVMKAMSLALYGAKGETRKIISDLLGIENNEKIEEFQRLMVNDKVFNSLDAAWFKHDLDFEDSYLEFLKRIDCKNEKLNFADNNAKDVINKWVEKETDGNIKDLIHSTDENTALILTSVCNFVGKWLIPFDVERTKDRVFELSNGQKIKTPTMEMKEDFLYSETDDCQMVSLPYEDGYCMNIYLPKESKNNFDLEEASEYFSKNAKELKVNLTLPKFKMSKEYDIRKTFTGMGFESIFSNNADFSGINKNISISEIVHKTFVECEEKGTKASAATAVGMVLKCMVKQPDIVNFKADHPFVFTINKNNNVLFIGKVENPNE